MSEENNSSGAPLQAESSSETDAAPGQGPGMTEQPHVQQGITAVNLDSRLKELEGFLSERDKEIAELKKSLESAGQEGKSLSLSLSERDKSLSTLLIAYRTSIMQAHPDIPEEMVTGNTLEELQASLGKAKDLVKKIREKMPPQEPGAPAGAPPRRGPDLSAMTAREKIVQGLNKK